MSTVYYRCGTCVSEATGDPTPSVPEGCTEISQGEYLALLNQAAAEREAQQQAEQAAAARTKRLLQNAPSRLVAASSAPPEVREAATYVCDGTDDQVQINAAIMDTVTAGPGGTVVLSSGGFFLSDSVKVPASLGLTLAGDGPGTVLWNMRDDRYAVAFTGQVSGATLKDFSLDCDLAAPSSGTTAGGINADAASRSDFSRLSLEGCNGYGIHMGSDGSAVNNRVTGCRFSRNGQDGVYVSGPDHRLMDNSFQDVGLGSNTPGDAAGIHLAAEAVGCIVTGNNLSTAPADGQAGSLVRESDGSHSNLISGNVFVQNGTAANGLLYQIAPGTGTRVVGNVGVEDS